MALRRWLIAAATTLFILLIAADSPAQVVEAQVEIKGMSCPFCAFGVEKKLSAVKGVAEVGVEMKDGRADLTAAEGRSIDIAAVPEAVRKAGFTPGTIEIVARGTLVKKGDGVAVRLMGSQETLALRTTSRHEGDEARRLADGTTVVEVTGIWHFVEDGGQAIEVVSIRRISE